MAFLFLCHFHNEIFLYINIKRSPPPLYLSRATCFFSLFVRYFVRTYVSKQQYCASVTSARPKLHWNELGQTRESAIHVKRFGFFSRWSNLWLKSVWNSTNVESKKCWVQSVWVWKMGETNDTKLWAIRSTIWINHAKPDVQLRNLVCLVHSTDSLDAVTCLCVWSGRVDTCDRRARTKLWTDKGFETLISLYRSLANTLNGEMRSHWT